MKRFRVVLPLLLVAGVSACSDSDSSSPTAPLPPNIDPAFLASCSAVSDALAAELRYLQFCTRASDCGQALVGTSCGCTRDLVARRDADPVQFYEIFARGQELSCNSLGFVSPCDCPPADGFACVANRCAWNYTES